MIFTTIFPIPHRAFSPKALNHRRLWSKPWKNCSQSKMQELLTSEFFPYKSVRKRDNLAKIHWKFQWKTYLQHMRFLLSVLADCLSFTLAFAQPSKELKMRQTESQGLAFFLRIFIKSRHVFISFTSIPRHSSRTLKSVLDLCAGEVGKKMCRKYSRHIYTLQ